MNTKMLLQKMPIGLSLLYSQIYRHAVPNDIDGMVLYVEEILRAVALAFRPLSCEELATVAGLPCSKVQEVEDYVDQCGSILLIQDAPAPPHSQECTLRRTVHLFINPPRVIF